MQYESLSSKFSYVQSSVFYMINLHNMLLFLCSILNKLTPEKFDVLKGQLIDSGITTPDILKVFIVKYLGCCLL